MAFCSYQLLADGHWHCTVCGDVAKRMTTRVCKARGKPNPPTWIRKLGNFTAAAIGHALKRCPSCTDAEIESRHEICKACELYRPETGIDAGVCTHPTCGCPITRAKKFASAIAWRDKQCPLGKWPDLT